VHHNIVKKAVEPRVVGKWFRSKNDANIVNSFSRFLKVPKISLVKKLTVWQLEIELESLHKLKFYLSVLLLMIKMSQSGHEKLDSYCWKEDRPWIYNLCNVSKSASGQFDNLLSKKQIEVSFLCVCLVIDNEFHYIIIKVVCWSWLSYHLVDPQLLWQCYDEIHDQ